MFRGYSDLTVEVIEAQDADELQEEIDSIVDDLDDDEQLIDVSVGADCELDGYVAICFIALATHTEQPYDLGSDVRIEQVHIEDLQDFLQKAINTNENLVNVTLTPSTNPKEDTYVVALFSDAYKAEIIEPESTRRRRRDGRDAHQRKSTSQPESGFLDGMLDHLSQAAAQEVQSYLSDKLGKRRRRRRG